MNSAQVLSPRSQPALPWIRRGLALAGAAAAAALVSAVLFFAFLRLAYSGRVLPGVSSSGVSLAGMTLPEVEIALGSTFTYPQTGILILRDRERLWTAAPGQLGVVMDVGAMARSAMGVGREGGLGAQLSRQARAWFAGYPVGPQVIFDERTAAAYLGSVAAEIDRPTVEAILSVVGLEVSMVPGQIGRFLDIPATIQSLTPTISRLYDAEVALVIREDPPLVLDATAQAELAREILSEPMVLTAEGAGPWTFGPADLAGLMRFNRVIDDQGARYQVGLDPDALRLFLEPLAPELERKPENARFIFNDETHVLDLLESAIIGRTLDIQATIEAVNTDLATGAHEIGLAFITSDPEVGDDATGEELGIIENVVDVSTYFHGSSPNRIQNIATSAAAFHGLLIPPGATVSMADILGDISLDTGYAEALIIYGNRTIKGVGGGVCQVSTTLYRAAFMGGYQIDERYPHAYRVTYYELDAAGRSSTRMTGMDATVFPPTVDFRFTNDTPYWLLMETYLYGNRQIQWKFYSTSEGRSVEWTTSGPQNVKEAPEPLYRENSELPEGKIEQVDFEADGMDVVVNRTVTRGGEVLHQNTFRTHYLPWRAIYEFGPGTDLPDDVEIEED